MSKVTIGAASAVVDRPLISRNYEGLRERNEPF